MKEAFSTPLQGHDSIRILTQILSLQTLHYLILATLLPPFLAIFAETNSLMFEGGPTQIGMVFDWKQLAGKPTYDWNPPKDWLSSPNDGEFERKEAGKVGEVGIDPAVLVKWNLDNVWLDQPLPGTTDVQGKVLDHDQILRFKSSPSSSSSSSNEAEKEDTVEKAIEHWEWHHTRDSHRSYVLIITWLLTAPLDILLLVFLVRRPTHMLDHALTFHFLNLVICSYYSGGVPTSLTWWLTMLVHAAVVIVWSEQLAIKREMGRGVGYSLVGSGDVEVAERGGGRKQRGEEVVFDSEQEGLIRGGERIEMKPL